MLVLDRTWKKENNNIVEGGCASIPPLTYTSLLLHICSMQTYLDTIKDQAKLKKVDLLLAFKVAGLPTSTYYRTINGKTEMRFETACSVLDAIDEQHRRDEAAKRAKQLRDSGQTFDRSEARKGVKPRSIGA